MIYKEYNKIFEEINNLSGPVSLVKYLRPTNLDSQKKLFFRNKFQINPQFEYTKPKFENTERLKNIQVPNDEIGDLAKQKIERVLRLQSLLKTSNDSEFIKISKRVFDHPDSTYTSYAKKILNKKNNLIPGNKLSFEEIENRIKNKLDKFPVKVKLKVIREPSFANKITASKNSITISEKYVADTEEVEDLLAHELETHIRRNYNGSNHPLHVFKYGTARYLESEEGLANIMGTSVRKNKLMVHQAFLHLAIVSSIESDFVTAFREIKKYTDDDERAWTYVLRAKRGIQDTSKAGAYTKDQYLQYALKTAKKIIEKPNLLQTAFDGLGNIDELYKYNSSKSFKSSLTLSSVEGVYKNNTFK